MFEWKLQDTVVYRDSVCFSFATIIIFNTHLPIINANDDLFITADVKT